MPCAKPHLLHGLAVINTLVSRFKPLSTLSLVATGAQYLHPLLASEQSALAPAYNPVPSVSQLVLLGPKPRKDVVHFQAPMRLWEELVQLQMHLLAAYQVPKEA